MSAKTTISFVCLSFTDLYANDEANHGPCSAGKPSGALFDSFPHHDPHKIFSGPGDSAGLPEGVDIDIDTTTIATRAVQQTTIARDPLAQQT